MTRYIKWFITMIYVFYFGRRWCLFSSHYFITHNDARICLRSLYRTSAVSDKHPSKKSFINNQSLKSYAWSYCTRLCVVLDSGSCFDIKLKRNCLLILQYDSVLSVFYLNDTNLETRWFYITLTKEKIQIIQITIRYWIKQTHVSYVRKNFYFALNMFCNINFLIYGSLPV